MLYEKSNQVNSEICLMPIEFWIQMFIDNLDKYHKDCGICQWTGLDELTK